MKNVAKVMKALENAYKGHRIEMLYVAEQNRDKIFVDGTLVGYFDDEFFNADFDNPKIEIKIKAPLYTIKDFLEEVECDGVFYRAVERGLKEWEEESQRNS